MRRIIAQTRAGSITPAIAVTRSSQLQHKTRVPVLSPTLKIGVRPHPCPYSGEECYCGAERDNAAKSEPNMPKWQRQANDRNDHTSPADEI
jgi:hypothetical protein